MRDSCLFLSINSNDMVMDEFHMPCLASMCSLSAKGGKGLNLMAVV
jgi:hypothetical protein